MKFNYSTGLGWDNYEILVPIRSDFDMAEVFGEANMIFEKDNLSIRLEYEFEEDRVENYLYVYSLIETFQFNIIKKPYIIVKDIKPTTMSLRASVNGESYDEYFAIKYSMDSDRNNQADRSQEHTSQLQSHSETSYAVFSSKQ